MAQSWKEVGTSREGEGKGKRGTKMGLAQECEGPPAHAAPGRREEGGRPSQTRAVPHAAPCTFPPAEPRCPGSTASFFLGRPLHSRTRHAAGGSLPRLAALPRRLPAGSLPRESAPHKTGVTFLALPHPPPSPFCPGVQRVNKENAMAEKFWMEHAARLSGHLPDVHGRSWAGHPAAGAHPQRTCFVETFTDPPGY